MRLDQTVWKVLEFPVRSKTLLLSTLTSNNGQGAFVQQIVDERRLSLCATGSFGPEAPVRNLTILIGQVSTYTVDTQ